MLEILAIWFLAKQIGNIVEQKGRKSGWYKVMLVAFWIIGEIVGAIVGVVVSGGDSSAQCLLYVFALVGAALGAGVAFLIAKNLSPVTPPPSELAPTDTPNPPA